MKKSTFWVVCLFLIVASVSFVYGQGFIGSGDRAVVGHCIDYAVSYGMTGYTGSNDRAFVGHCRGFSALRDSRAVAGRTIAQAQNVAVIQANGIPASAVSCH